VALNRRGMGIKSWNGVDPQAFQGSLKNPLRAEMLE
jgi:hypothetical protein